MNNDGIFTITFNDDTTFEGNLFNKDWGKIDETKAIKEIVFVYGGRRIKMENFREYNLTMEIHSVFGKKQQLRNITLTGRDDNYSTLLMFDFKEGEVVRKVVTKYTEYGNLIATTWKKGLTSGIAKDYYV